MTDALPFSAVPTSQEIGDWFTESCPGAQVNQGSEGFKLWRDGHDYCYLWVEAWVDHDLMAYYLIDVRTSIGSEPFSEERDFLFVANGYFGTVVTPMHEPIPFNAGAAKHRARNYRGLVWLAEQIQKCTEDLVD